MADRRDGRIDGSRDGHNFLYRCVVASKNGGLTDESVDKRGFMDLRREKATEAGFETF